MQPTFDPNTGQIIYGQDDNGNNITTMPGSPPTLELMPDGADPYIWEIEQRQKQQYQSGLAAANKESQKEQPFISGAIVGDLAKTAVNLPTGFATDLVDLGLGVVDVGRAAASSAGIGDFGWDQVFDDRDNPLTQFRRQTVGTMDTGLGSLVNQVGRLGFDFVGFKWVYKAPIVAQRVQRIARMVDRLSDIKGIKGIKNATRASRAVDAANTARRQKRLAKIGGDAAKRGLRNDYLAATYKQLAGVPEATSWWKQTQNAASAWAKSKVTFKSLSETLAWDLFLAFNVMGEGDDEMDETLFDFAQDLGFDNGLTLDPMDSGISRKLKGMLDGTLTAGIGGAFVDFYRIGRFSKQVKKASKSERKRLIDAFSAEADELGRSVAEVAEAERKFSSAVRRGTVDPNSSLQQMLQQMEGRVAVGPQTLDDYAQLDFSPYRTPVGGDPTASGRQSFRQFGDPESPVQQSLAQMEGVASDVRSPANFNARRLEQDPGLLPDDPARNNPFERVQFARNSIDRAERTEAEAIQNLKTLDQAQPQKPEIQDATPLGTVMRRVREAEPTLSPIGMRAYARQMIDAGFTPAQVERAVLQALPRKNVDLVEYAQLGTYVNRYGVVDAVDGLIGDFIYRKGLREGWAGVTPSGEKFFNRSKAVAADQTDLVMRQAEALDELRAIKQRDDMQKLRAQELADEAAAAAQDAKMKSNRLQPVLEDQPVAGLTDEEKMARNRLQPGEVPIDADQTAQLAEAELADPALRNAEVDATNAELNNQALTDEELSRAAQSVTATDPDVQVREMLGIDPSSIKAEIEKAPDGRGWFVITPSGEQLGERFTTKRAAQRKADAETRRLRQDVQSRAQQQADDATDQIVEVAAFNPARDSDLPTKVKLTKPQIMELIKYPNFRPIFDQFGVNKKTYEFTQSDLNEFIDGARAMIAAGVDKPRARMLNRLIDKFDVAVKQLEPEVRQAREVDSILAQNKKFADHGDYC